MVYYLNSYSEIRLNNYSLRYARSGSDLEFVYSFYSTTIQKVSGLRRLFKDSTKHAFTIRGVQKIIFVFL